MLRQALPDDIAQKLLQETAHSGTDQQPPRPVGQKDSKGRMYATGKRKTSIARVWVKPGKGLVVVNDRSQEDYFGRETLRLTVLQPLQQTNRAGQYDVWCTVAGGGLSGQAGAIRHGISKALNLIEPELRPVLKQADLLRRDDRRVERKKPGQHGARRGCQFKKR